MSNNPKNKPPESLPEIPNLTKEQLNRLLTADYLDAIAKLIRRGAVTGFDFAWDERYEKPLGNVVMTSTELVAPLETKLLKDIQEAMSTQKEQIRFEDLTQTLREHGKCSDPKCMACNNPNKA